MSAGGNIILINNTDYDWTNNYQHSYQMDTWIFPQTIAAGTSTNVRISYEEKTGKTWTDDAADVIYQLSYLSAPTKNYPNGQENPIGSSFHIQASHPGTASGEGNISVTFTGISTSKYPAGTSVDLGFVQNGDVVLFLACDNGTYYIGDIYTPYQTWG